MSDGGSYNEVRAVRAEHAENVLSDARMVERCADGDGCAVCIVTGHARRVPVLFLNRFVCRPGRPTKDLLVYGKCVRCGDAENLYSTVDGLTDYWCEVLGWPSPGAKPSALARYMA